ncbi:MAG TPA: hypothetical protein PLP25_08160, partial [Candidatus Limiplasma sp.]|nr:hypothetical protein [Candidatus Limiplasma sp.]
LSIGAAEPFAMGKPDAMASSPRGILACCGGCSAFQRASLPCAACVYAIRLTARIMAATQHQGFTMDLLRPLQRL